MEVFDLISPVEDAILDRLKAKLENRVLVQPYPDNPESYEPTHPVGAVMVRYAEADYSDSLDTAAVVQERDMLFEVTLAMWSLRGKQGGIYLYLEAVRQFLTGFTPPSCDRKLTPDSEGFVSRSAGLKNKSQRLWQYQITFKTRTINVEIPEEQLSPLLKHISVHDNFAVTTEVPSGT